MREGFSKSHQAVPENVKRKNQETCWLILIPIFLYQVINNRSREVKINHDSKIVFDTGSLFSPQNTSCFHLNVYFEPSVYSFLVFFFPFGFSFSLQLLNLDGPGLSPQVSLFVCLFSNCTHLLGDLIQFHDFIWYSYVEVPPIYFP